MFAMVLALMLLSFACGSVFSLGMSLIQRSNERAMYRSTVARTADSALDSADASDSFTMPTMSASCPRDSHWSTFEYDPRVITEILESSDLPR